MMKHKCLYCYQELSTETDYHEKCSLKFFGTKQAPILPYTLAQITDLAKDVVARSISVPGVQPKLSLTISSKSSEKRLTVVGVLGGNYIFKPPVAAYPEMPQNEHVSMRLAELFGIQTVPSTLIRLKSGELAYLTKRIDRTKAGQKIHMLDMFQITEAFDKYKSSMEKIGKALAVYSSNMLLDQILFFELTLFSYLIGNNDMHLKNFAMINQETGWLLAPAYDLLNVSILIPEDQEQLALTLKGKKSNFKKTDFIDFGLSLGLNSKQINAVFKRFETNKKTLLNMLAASFLSKNMMKNYKDLVLNRFKILAK